MQESLKLSEFLELIKSTIEMGFGYDGYWVRAELSEWRMSGKHYYGELIEHDGLSKYPVAKVRCNCWANKAGFLHSKFTSVTGEPLKSDMKVMLKVAVSYHVSFGLSLNVIDIEPAFTLGDRQARKLEIIETLTTKKIINKNRSLELPSDFTNIAVITSITAAGKGDFFEEADKLQDLGLCKFDIFEAKMQGQDCAVSVAKAFDKIAMKADKYDAIVIIRGGGSQADLDWFNNILPAESICNSEIPVMVGIGHERDSTVLDDICTKKFDTPSKVINFITNTIIDNATNANHNYQAIVNITKNLAKQTSSNLENLYKDFRTKLGHYLQNVDYQVEQNYKNTKFIATSFLKLYTNTVEGQFENITVATKNLIKYYQHSLDEYFKNTNTVSKNMLNHYTQTSEYLYKQILSVSVEPTLKRGFSITKSDDGKYITTQAQALKHSNLNIVYSDGQIQVEVNKNGSTK
ncbi:MAG: exodeoxyribonuclease VII large subunit [Francisella sp.]|jgi:exodeoxyribonuclease VII large subunit